MLTDFMALAVCLVYNVHFLPFDPTLKEMARDCMHVG